MSGGSYNYLCMKELSDFFYHGFGEEWEWMLDRLENLSPQAREEMESIQSSVREFEKKYEKRWNVLQPLLKAVEWKDSGDWGDEQLSVALKKFSEAVGL